MKGMSMVGGARFSKPYDESIAVAICEGLESGRTLLEMEPSLGFDVNTMYRWLDSEPSFREMYSRARRNRADSFAEKQLDTVQMMLAGEITPEQCRVANDAYKWTAAKLRPDTYSDKVQTTNDTSIKISVEYGSTPSLPSSVIDVEGIDVD